MANKKNKIDLVEKLKDLKKQENKKKKGKNPFIMLFITAIIIAVIYSFFSTGQTEVINDKLGINQVVSNYSSGVYSEILIDGNKLLAKRKQKPEDKVKIGNKEIILSKIDRITLPPNDGLVDLGFNQKGNPTKVSVKDDTWSKFWSDFAPSIIGTILFVVLFLFIFSKMAGGTNGPMAFIKSRAKLYDPGKDKITFADVAGADEEKEELIEVVDFLKNPKKYRDLGAKIPRGVLMVGPPGTGKTLLARAVAGESGVPFFSISGSEFVEMFVGVGAARVRDLFKEAKEKSPSIIFIDEIDAIGKKRSPGIGGGHDEREQTLNQILTEMDGFDNDTNVIVMAATNRADVLDKALLRPGRFDRKITINLPNLEDRMKILEVHTKNKPLDPNIDLKKIAGTTVGFSGADLANLLNEAAILAGKLHSKTVTYDMIQKSVEKILMGTTKKSLKMTELEKKNTAFHEVGHAIVGKMLPNPDPVNKISILSRGMALGVTWFLPEKDRVSVSKAKYLDELAVLYGGRVAEEIFFGKENITTGASNDIEKATEIARAMVMRFGFDDELGAENFIGEVAQGNFLGGETQGKVISEKTQEIIDNKVRDILKGAYNKAKDIITKNRDLHQRISEELLIKEEMYREDFDAFFEGVEGVPEKNV
ncbi:MAG: ATP-dependent zinc metalloprotease FtsH [Candidatus Gracilibacteria bacterium]|nr:ATP-dependent zinc metalloprotease FtsH [Candidatus Gracilibacteria bacterium]